MVNLTSNATSDFFLFPIPHHANAIPLTNFCTLLWLFPSMSSILFLHQLIIKFRMWLKEEIGLFYVLMRERGRTAPQDCARGKTRQWRRNEIRGSKCWSNFLVSPSSSRFDTWHRRHDGGLNSVAIIIKMWRSCKRCLQHRTSFSSYSLEFDTLY